MVADDYVPTPLCYLINKVFHILQYFLKKCNTSVKKYVTFTNIKDLGQEKDDI